MFKVGDCKPVYIKDSCYLNVEKTVDTSGSRVSLMRTDLSIRVLESRKMENIFLSETHFKHSGYMEDSQTWESENPAMDQREVTLIMV